MQPLFGPSAIDSWHQVDFMVALPKIISEEDNYG